MSPACFPINVPNVCPPLPAFPAPRILNAMNDGNENPLLETDIEPRELFLERCHHPHHDPHNSHNSRLQMSSPKQQKHDIHARFPRPRAYRDLRSPKRLSSVVRRLLGRGVWRSIERGSGGRRFGIINWDFLKRRWL